MFYLAFLVAVISCDNTTMDHNKLSREEKRQGFVQLFNGTDMEGWIDDSSNYIVDNGILSIIPESTKRGFLFTRKEYGNFIFRFEFQLTPGANNGLAIRSPLIKSKPAYNATEIQILDNTAEKYKDLNDYQYHGSVYGVIPAKRGYLKPVGEWNEEEVYLQGDHIRVTLNDTIILEGNLEEAFRNGTPDGRNHPGLERDRGHIGFLGHGSVVRFRNIRIKSLD